jgi:CRISPR-associated endonuclease/helicase Cas3
VVDRRAVVDQATDEAERLAQRLAEHPDLCAALRLDPAAALTKRDGRRLALPVSTLRGQFADNRKWSENPAHPAIVVGTVDMIGSRLLFNGYRLSRRQWPVHAGLLAHDSLIVLDEAHLNAPFEGLLKDMTEMGRRVPGLPPVSRTLSLSATGAATDRRNPMTIEADDLAHPHVRRLLKAPKPLALRQPDGRRLPERLAGEALGGADGGGHGGKARSARGTGRYALPVGRGPRRGQGASGLAGGGRRSAGRQNLRQDDRDRRQEKQ